MLIRRAEEYWRQPHGSSWVENYAQSATLPVRKWLHDAIQSVGPFDSALDLGCNCGVLMPSLLAAAPNVQVVGIDVSPEALRDARRQYPTHTWVLSSVADWLPMLAIAGSHADVIVSSSCLEHVAVADIGETLAAMATVATRAILLQEVTVTMQMGEGPSLWRGVPEWRHDYQTRFDALGWKQTKKYWLDVTSNRPAAVMVFEPEDRTR